MTHPPRPETDLERAADKLLYQCAGNIVTAWTSETHSRADRAHENAKTQIANGMKKYGDDRARFERQRILGMLRSQDAADRQLNVIQQCDTHEGWADWLADQFKNESK